MAKEKPGVMMYWSMFDVLESLLDGQAKTMLHAIRTYSQYGEVTDFDGDAVLKTLWLLVKPQMDADNERYEKISNIRAVAGKKGGAPKGNQNASKNKQKQAKQAKQANNNNNNNNNNSNNNSNNNESKPTRHKHGEYNNVLLTDEEFEKLKEQGLESYINILSEGIECKGYKYKSHYAAIRRWAKKDQEKETAKEVVENGEYADLNKLFEV